MSIEEAFEKYIHLGIWKATCVHRDVHVPRRDLRKSSSLSSD